MRFRGADRSQRLFDATVGCDVSASAGLRWRRGVGGVPGLAAYGTVETWGFLSPPAPRRGPMPRQPEQCAGHKQ